MKKIVFLALTNLFLAFYFSYYFYSIKNFDSFPAEPTITAIDIGQGDALFIPIPETSIQILIDGGPPNKNLTEKIKKEMPRGDKTIDLVFLTHCHEDHLGGLGEVLDNFKVGLWVETGAVCENNLYKDLESKINSQKIPRLYSARGQKIKIGNFFLAEVVHPFFSVGAEYKNQNEASLSIFLDYAGKLVFLSGDLENKGEQALLNYLESKPEIKEKLKNTSMLKANHHGSSGSNSKEFLSLFPSGTNILISSGKNNKFGHPGEEAIKRMKDKDFKIKRTDQNGEITMPF